MGHYEYAVVPAPAKAEKVRGAKTTADRFAATLTQLMNGMGAEGWEYVRADTLPCEERKGFTGRTVNMHNLLVFRRWIEDQPAAQPGVPPLRAGWDDDVTVVGQPLGPATAPAPAVSRPVLVTPPVTGR